MANAPFGSGSSLLEELKGPDNSMQQINSGFSSVSFTPTISKGVIQKPDVTMSPMSSTMKGSLTSFVPQEPPYYPSSPMTPVFRQQSMPHMARAQSLGEDIQVGVAPRNNFAASPVIYSKRTFSPGLNNAPSQYLSGNNQHHDSIASFLPPPPNLDASDASHPIGRLDDPGLFLSDHDTQPKSPFVGTPRNNRGNAFQDVVVTRERALSSPGGCLRQPSFGAMPPSPAAPPGQILYEDKPSSWNEGSGFPAPISYRESVMPSPSNFDRFNSRPPRHCGVAKDAAQALLSPRVEMRHAASDGNFNFPSAIPIPRMSPIANNHGRSQSNIASAVIGSPSFDSSVQGGNVNDRNSFGSMDGLNPNMSFLQYPLSHTSSMPPGIAKNSARIPQDNCYVQQSPAPLGLQRQNSTGSQHFLVNERGEIVGHASPLITHNTLEGFAKVEPRNHFPSIRPQRANSYGGHANPFNQIQPQRGNLPIFNPIPLQGDGSIHDGSPPMENHVGSIGDGRMHHRHNTEPITPAIFNQNSGGNTHSRHPVSATGEFFDHILAGENIQGVDVASEEVRGVGGLGGAADEKAADGGHSYASKLMMQPSVVDQTKGGRASSHLLTAGASLAKSGPRMIFNVKFKRSQRNFILCPRVAREIKIGTYVKVEADRGEDLGIVMSIVTMDKFLSSNRHRSMTEDSIGSGDPPSPPQSANVGDLKRIMRVATHDEISLLEVKREEEEELLKICRTKVRQRGLPMTVVDAEYQFDRNKLTFFFQAEGRIDFRELVRDLFSMYKTRIWMQQLDKNGSPDEAQGNSGPDE
eukprot:CAMPEP_0172555042 /NCGR_PEP_ID=MMETSP1067-20121228/57720_1 /TAXON_ID=265564 ORGANISM="Thalassiosira punctigera, Strain Tpunct2005C2" /NCGR_SAMPLE_ID=MMETSP1067 /ASSEMBLY_ACC=CAM_ASM_000444 /LENGTH=804 /DNA_ID=CAMNT_0013343543 /DNA_START=66 /DNA_END=2480 /DNA_ORIENTATION=+